MIKRLKIRDFKSIRDIDLELDQVTVLVGRSGSGKSNIVQAIRFLRNLLLYFDEALAYEFGWERIVPVGELRPKTCVEVTFNVRGEEEDYTYRIAFSTPNDSGFPSHAIQLREETIRFGADTIFARERKGANAQWEWNTPPKVLPLPSPSDSRLVLGLLPSLQNVVFANAALSTGIGYYHFPSTTLSQAAAPQQHGQSLLQKVPGLSDIATNYREIMRTITQDFHNPNIRKSLLASMQAVNSSIASVELDSLVNPTKVIIGHKAADRVFALSLEQESDGLRRFYAHLLALYQSPAKLTLIFEEPENAIFPGALSVLADEFLAAPRERRGQVIITTHNPVFLDSFDVDNVRAVEMTDGRTLVGRVSKEQREAVKQHLLTTGDLLTADEARLEKPQSQDGK
jgi:predicted ATPase